MDPAMRIFFQFLVAVSLFAPVAWAGPDFIGRWEGPYKCGAQINSTMVLTIESSDRGRVLGVFEFNVVRPRAKGSYTVSGRVSETGEFRLSPLQWLDRAPGMMMVTINGRLTSGGNRIEGVIPECGPGSFHATLMEGVVPPSKVDPSPEEVSPGLPRKESPTKPKHRLPRAPAEWVKAIRTEIARMVREKAKPYQWNNIKMEVTLGSPLGVDSATKDALTREIAVARARLAAEPLLEELETAPTFDKNGLGGVLRVADRARTSDWPDEVKAIVRDAASARAAKIIRPELESLASLAEKLPSTLAGLIEARNALGRVMEYRASMERAFGSIDPEGLLRPLWVRLAEIEANSSVQDELRVALARAAMGPDPDVAIEKLLWQTLGGGPYSPAISKLVEEARQELEEANIRSALDKTRLPLVIERLIGGQIQTHADLPETDPLAYAMRHEFLDTLVATCGTSQPGYSAEERDLMYQWMVVYKLLNMEEMGDLSDANFVEAYFAFLANPATALGPSQIMRQDIATHPQGFVREAVSALGGCDDSKVQQLKASLAAIARMGAMPSPQKTLIEEAVNAQGDQVNCYYTDPARDNYRLFQIHPRAMPVSRLGLIDAIRAARGAPAALRRLHCPSIPDPSVKLSEDRIHISPDLESLPKGDRAERLAAAFLEQYLPEYVQLPDGSPLILEPDLRARYFDAIVKFERIVVPADEVQRLLAERKRAVANRQVPSGSPYQSAVERDLRLAKYKERHGRELFAVIEEVADLAGLRASYLFHRSSEFFDQVQ
jgi:hypothetical protein